MFLNTEPAGSVACAWDPSGDRQWTVARPTRFLSAGVALLEVNLVASYRAGWLFLCVICRSVESTWAVRTVARVARFSGIAPERMGSYVLLRHVPLRFGPAVLC